MRIIHILNHSLRLSGQVHAAVDLACAQSQLGHQVAICSAKGSFDALLAANGVETFIINQARKPYTMVKAVHAFYGLVRRWRPDVVHAHMMTSALLSWPVCKVAGVPLITTVHNEFQKGAIAMGVGDRVIAVSSAVGRSMARRGISPSRLRVVLNGTIGAARLYDPDRTPQRLPSPSIVFVGGLHPRKGVADLIEAFATVWRSHPSAHLVIVGEGPCSGQYKSIAAASEAAPNITFAGDRDDVQSYLLGADVFSLPSHADPAPLVLSEAREAGCAIVATDVDGIPELLDHGRAGILVPPKNPAQLASALTSLLDDPSRLALWRRNSQLGIEHLSIRRVADETLRVYEECTKSAPVRLAPRVSGQA